MTVYGLQARYENATHNGGHFFDHDTLKFFGERMSEMRVLKETVKVKTYRGEEHECYVLSSVQHNHPLGKRRVYHYFDTTTFEHIIPED